MKRRDPRLVGRHIFLVTSPARSPWYLELDRDQERCAELASRGLPIPPGPWPAVEVLPGRPSR